MIVVQKNIMFSLRQLNPSNIMFIEMNSLTIDDYLPDKIHLKPSGYQKIENFILSVNLNINI